MAGGSRPARSQPPALAVSLGQQLETAVAEAQAEDAIDSAEEPAQIAYELNAYLLLANAQFVATGEPHVLDRARQAIERLLRAASAPETT